MIMMSRTGLLTWPGSSSCDHHDLATMIDLDHVVVIIQVMTPGIWAINLDHLVVSMKTWII